MRLDDPQDLLVVWQGYNWEDKAATPWSGKICPTCLEAVPVVRGKMALHMRDASQPYKPEDDRLCPGGGVATDPDAFKRNCGCWIVLDRDTGKTLGTHPTEEGARSQANEVRKCAGLAPIRADEVRRFDRVTIKPTKRTQEGFLRIDGSKIARVGVQIYRRADGKIVRELREPDQVFDQKSMKGFGLLPLTNGHPSTLLDTTTAKAHAVGAVGEASKLDDTWLTAPISVWDQQAIRDIEDGKVQLSAGYTCTLDETPGEHPQYGKFDCRQVGVVPNHLSLVTMARAGAEARLRLDGNDAELMDEAPISVFENDVLPSTQVRETLRMAHKMTLDGFTVELPDANAEAVILKAIASAQKAGEKSAKKETERADQAEQAKADAEKAKGEAQKTLDALQGKFDTLNAQVQTAAARTIKFDGADVPVADFLDDTKREALLSASVAKAAQARTALVIEAQKHLGTKEKLDGKSDLEVKKAVVMKLNKNAKLDGKSEDYVQACYDTAIEGATSNVRPIDAARAGAAPAVGAVVVNDAAPTDSKSAYEAMRLRALAANPKNQVR